MFKKLFGKKDGFYMQIDESATPKDSVPKTPEATTPRVASVSEKAVVADAPVAEAVAATTNTQEKAKSTKTSIKKEKKDKKDAKKDLVESQPVAVTPAKTVPTITNFATDYLIIPAVAGNRRRPGANMKGFMTMAREVKEAKKGSQANQANQKKKETYN
jgi:hypothetical protein